MLTVAGTLGWVAIGVIKYLVTLLASGVFAALFAGVFFCCFFLATFLAGVDLVDLHFLDNTVDEAMVEPQKEDSSSFSLNETSSVIDVKPCSTTEPSYSPTQMPTPACQHENSPSVNHVTPSSKPSSEPSTSPPQMVIQTKLTSNDSTSNDLASTTPTPTTNVTNTEEMTRSNRILFMSKSDFESLLQFFIGQKRADEIILSKKFVHDHNNNSHSPITSFKVELKTHLLKEIAISIGRIFRSNPVFCT